VRKALKDAFRVCRSAVETLDGIHNIYLRNLIPLIVGCFGLFLGFYGINEVYTRTTAQPDAHRITCQELITDGPGDNGHIILTDYSLDLVRFAKVPSSDRQDAWFEAWVPVLPTPVEKKRPSAFHVVLLSARAVDQKRLGEIQANGEVEGTIVNHKQSYSPAAVRELRSQYPDTDFDHCLILLHGYAPMSNSMLISMFLGSVLFAAASVNLFIYVNVRRRPQKKS
jgi:hypothetical protein